MHDPIVSVDFVSDELDQQRESGHDVADAQRAHEAVEPEDRAALEQILGLLEVAPLVEDWDYDEPDDLPGILATLPAVRETTLDDSLLEDKIRGGWLGRIAGCNLGKPLEFGPHWTSDHIRAYLELAGAYPLRDYVPLLDPDARRIRAARVTGSKTTTGQRATARRVTTTSTTRSSGCICSSSTAVRSHPGHVAAAWLELFPFHQVYTAERAAYANLVADLPLEEVARHRNPYREWIGALIRGDIYGWTHPGAPARRDRLAYQDASLSHTANGIYGEHWSAALVSVCVHRRIRPPRPSTRALDHIPPRSRLAEALRDVLVHASRGSDLGRRARGDPGALRPLQLGAHDQQRRPHRRGTAVGRRRLRRHVGLTVQGGWDTDSNGATAGSVAGVLAGAGALPAHFIEPLARSHPLGAVRLRQLADLRSCGSDHRTRTGGTGLSTPSVRPAMLVQRAAACPAAALWLTVRRRQPTIV